MVDTTTVRRDRGLKGFAAGADAGVDMMTSSATYSKIDARRRAFSKIVIGQMVRGDLKFTKVVVSDDLAAPAVRVLPPGARAVTFLAAGGDLIIVGDPTLAPTMVGAIKAKAAADARFRASILPKTTRILQMRARRGLTSCS